MSRATELLTTLRRLQVKLWVEGENLRLAAPPNTITPELRQELATNKAEIITFLREAARSASAASSAPTIPLPAAGQSAAAVQPTIQSTVETTATANRKMVTGGLSSLRQVARPARLPLSFAQERLWFLHQLEPESPMYNVPQLLRLRGPLHLAALETSLAQVIERHEILRTIFDSQDGQAFQVISTPRPFHLDAIDLPGAGWRAWVRAEANRPFDLACGPLLRATLIRTAPEEALLFLNLHHIVTDGWSARLFLQELAAGYNAVARGEALSLPDLPIQYADYAIGQRARMQGEPLRAEREYWNRHLADVPETIELLTDRPRPARQTYRGATASCPVSAELLDELKAFSASRQVTLFMTLLTAFEILLHRYSGQAEFSVGTPIANRAGLEIEALIGFFVNTLVLRADLTGDPDALELLGRVREAVIGAFAHPELPLEMLVEERKVERDLSRNALFQVIFALQADLEELPAFAGLVVEDVPITTDTAKFDLTFFFNETRQGASIAVEYNTDLYDAGTIQRMMAHFQTVLRGMLFTPQEKVTRLPILPEEERRQVVEEWNATNVDFGPPACLHALFQAQAARTPDAIALVFGEQQMTYAALDRQSDRLAAYLQRLGVGPEAIIGLCLERSPEMVVGLLGILKAGGAYLPLDPAFPVDRLGYMLEDAQVSILLTQAKLLPFFQSAGLAGLRRVCLDDLDETRLFSAEDDPDRTAPKDLAGPENLAYVIYTSGSTGRPKGVQITHASVVNFLYTMMEQPGMSGLDTLLAVTTLSFDIAGLELYLPLSVGARVVIASGEATHDGYQLAELLEKHKVTVMQATPATWQMLLASQWPGKADLRILCGGEALSPALANALLPRCAELWNLYGPTETTIWMMVERVTAQRDALTIGRPVANTQVYVLDAQLQPAPIGVPGELYIGGAQVGRGYLYRPELTAERFIPNPFGPGRLYKTGDQVRYLPDGNIEFLGRMDFQVKLHGYRIELGEIESELAACPGVAQVVVVVRGAEQGSPRLVGYLTLQAGFQAEAVLGGLREQLKTRLPDYMVPTAFMVLDDLPQTPNRKIDRKALPEPERAVLTGTAEYAAPQTAVEQALAEIWAGLLGVERVGRRDNFFELGGDSIVSLQMISRAQAKGLYLTPRQVFEAQTIEALGVLAQARQGVTAEQGLVVGTVPLTPIQRRFFAQHGEHPNHFNQSVLIEVERSIEAGLLREALSVVLRQHDALRARFERTEGGWRQEYGGAEALTCPVDVVDLSGMGLREQVAQIKAINAHLQASFDISTRPLLRVALFEMGTGQAQKVLIIVHHLVVDFVSWQVLVEDLLSVYDQLVQKKRPYLAEKTSSFKAWAEGQMQEAGRPERLAELEYWQGVRTTSERGLPVDFPGEGGRSRMADAGFVEVTLPVEETRALLAEVPSAYHTQINDVLLAALAQAFAEWTGESELLVDLEGHGRESEELDLSRTVGWFTAIYPVRLRQTGGDAGDVLKAVKEQLRMVPNKGLGYGLLRYLNPQGDEVLGSLPQAEVCFNYSGQLKTVQMRLLGQEWSGETELGYRFNISAGLEEEQLVVTWLYSQKLYRHETVAGLAEGYLRALRGLIAHCLQPGAGGFTPSDFPLSGLSQAELDRLIGRGVGVEDIYPLSPVQAGMLFHSVLAPGTGMYFLQNGFRIDGGLDVALWRGAWQLVMERHTILRTAFVWEGLAQPMQIVYEQVELPWEEQDWRGLPEAEQAERLESLLAAERVRGFALDQAPLARCLLVRVGEASYQFVWQCHHLLTDGWSGQILFKELFALYENLAAVIPGARPYREYVAWLEQQNLQRAHPFWRDYLAGFAAPTPLVVDRSYPKRGYRQVQVAFSHNLSTQISQFARQHRLTINTLMQGAYAVLLHRYSGEPGVVFGITVSGRTAAMPGIEERLGPFLNTLPLRVSFADDPLLLPWLEKLQQDNIAQNEYAHTPLLEIQRQAQIPSGASLFESILIFENYPVQAGLSAAPGAFRMRDFYAREQTNYPLSIEVMPGEQFQLLIIYDRSRFDADTIARLAGHFQELLAGMMVDADQPASHLPLLTTPERRQLLLEWNDTAAAFPAGMCIHQLFEAWAAETPDAVALVFENDSITYGELNRRANQLAQALRRLGVGPEVLVGICLERSLDMVVGLLGILKAGGAYLPLDPAFPSDRLAYMLEDAQVSILLTQAKLLPLFESASALRRICLDRDDIESPGGEVDGGPSLAAPGDLGMPDNLAAPENLAYVIYTSGSTGRPKGVQITHGSVVNFLYAMMEQPEMSARDTLLAVTTLSFDIAGLELYLPLSVGARVVVASSEAAKDGFQLADLLTHHDVTVMQATPATWQMLLASQWPGKTNLRILCGGEALSPSLANNLLPRCAELWNLYGPTETTIWMMVEQVTPQRNALTIGRPVANTQVYVLDAQLQPQPIGVPGELYIGGVQVGRGYLYRPELTAEKFIPNPFGPGRLYKTGDQVRYLADGSIEFLGRMDFQVKLHGYRIELGEIESELAACPGVAQAVVTVRGAEQASPRLVGYITLQAGFQAEAVLGSLREQLKTRLPEYMVPTAYMVLDALPQTPNRKIDRKALPEPERGQIAAVSEYLPPQTAAEQVLAEIWVELLGVERVGRRDNFFELGGDSIVSLQMISRAQAKGLYLTPRQVFEAQTIETLAALAQTRRGVTAEQGLVVGDTGALRGRIAHRRAPGAGGFTPSDFPLSGLSQAELDRLIGRGEGVEDIYPLSPAQTEMLSQSLNVPGAGLYVLQNGFRIEGALDVARWRGAWQAVVGRHTILRTAFAWEGLAHPLQIVYEQVDLPWEEQDWRGLPEAEQAERLESLLAAERMRGFALNQAPLARCLLVRVEEASYQFVWQCHHLLTDGWSLSLLFQEVFALYTDPRQALSAARPYRDYIAWLARQDGQEAQAFWRARLNGSVASAVLPFKKIRPFTYSGRYAEETLTLSPEDTAWLQSFAQQHHLTLAAVCQAAWALVLRRSGSASSTGDVVFGVTVSGRGAGLAEIDRRVGPFINTLPMRINILPRARVLDWLRAVVQEQAVLEQYAFAQAPLPATRPGPGNGPPLFVSTLRYQNFPFEPPQALAGQGLAVDNLFSIDPWHYPINLVIVPGAGLRLEITYDAQYFSTFDIRALLDEMAKYLYRLARLAADDCLEALLLG